MLRSLGHDRINYSIVKAEAKANGQLVKENSLYSCSLSSGSDVVR